MSDNALEVFVTFNHLDYYIVFIHDNTGIIEAKCQKTSVSQVIISCKNSHRDERKEMEEGALWRERGGRMKGKYVEIIIIKVNV